MSMDEQILPHYTWDDYLQWEGRWELIGGSPIAMSPSPSLKHQWVAGNVFAELRVALKNSGCKNCKVYIPIDYKVSEDTVLQPDLSIVCGAGNKKFLDFPPALVVEILSPSTALRDRHTKFRIYEQQGVKWYLLVNPDSETIELFTLTNGAYELVSFHPSESFTFLLEGECSIELVMEKIWS